MGIDADKLPIRESLSDDARPLIVNAGGTELVQGPRAAPVTYEAHWTYSDVIGPPPLDGQVRADSATALTELYVAVIDADGFTRIFELNTLHAGDSRILIRDASGEFAEWRVDTITENADFWTFAVTPIVSSTGTITKNTPLSLMFVNG